jgi:hypothetical protein
MGPSDVKLFRGFEEPTASWECAMSTRAIIKTTFGALSIFAMVSSACGPDAPQTNDGTNTSTGGDMSSTGIPTGSSTGMPEPCSLVHEGDLIVRDDTDLAPLTEIGRETGPLVIVMEERDQRDLTFLSCLDTIDGELDINTNALLESTKGLENLKSVDSITIRNNDNLRTVTGFDQISGLEYLLIYNNPALAEIKLDSIETVDWIQIGHCVGGHLALVDLPGFSGLTTVQRLTIEGNEALMSAGLLDALAANGAPSPLPEAVIRFNPLLSESTVQTQLDTLGVPDRYVCENADGDPECVCDGEDE